MKKFSAIAAAVVAAIGPCVAHAQSSLTLYGLVDVGVAYQSSSGSLGQTSGGHSAVTMVNGVRGATVFGMKGVEDIGGGTKVLFRLEQGFNASNGAETTPGLAFKRQANMGVTNDNYGTLTLGRGFSPYVILLSPWSPTHWLTGFFGAHPGDIDMLDLNYVNNQIMYISPTIHGFTFGGSYALGGQPGSINSGSTYSLDAQYNAGRGGLAVGFLRINNSASGGGAWGPYTSLSNNGAEPSISALTNGFQYAQAQQRIALTGGWQVTDSFDVSGSLSNTQYIPGINSHFSTEEVFNSAGVVAHWMFGPAWSFATGYSFVHASQANGSEGANYHEVTTQLYYSLSKATGVYALAAWTHASGQTLSATGTVIRATPTIGDGFNGTPGTGTNVFAAGVGILHRF
ncbi:porin [Paraburkholderia tropica]|uniref:porin n=1 Tax=Paraburkholderia tropica TaxID=92647 RepID=UPI002AB0C6A7|nr:porin [Paraburkholderia tropica]